jgi:hypothetical protein
LKDPIFPVHDKFSHQQRHDVNAFYS